MTRKTLQHAALLSGLLLLTAASPRLGAQEISLTPGKDKVPVARIFDPSKDETTVSVAPAMEDPGLGLSLMVMPRSGPGAPTGKPLGWPFKLKNIYYVYPGRTPARPRHVEFGFISGGKREKHTENLDFSVSADGEQLHRGKMEYSQLFYEPGYLSVLIAAVPTDLFLRVAGARKVRFEVGSRSYELSGAERKHMRALAEAVGALRE